MSVHDWSPITDLPESWERLASQELLALGNVWSEQADRFRDSPALSQFNERLCRQWAIETGLLENLYSIDRGTTQLLIEQGIDAALIPHGATDKPAEQVVAMVRDQRDALDALFDFVARWRDLSTSFIREMHQSFTRNQKWVDAMDAEGRMRQIELIRGDWKKWPNNPLRRNGSIHFYAPPEQVASEIDRLIAMHAQHVASGVPPEIEAAWLHHRFTHIHPFQDGNGRVARALATLIFLRHGWFPLVILSENRKPYIAALEAADQGDLAPLVSMFTTVQKRALIRALSVSETVIDEQKGLQTVLDALDESLQARRQSRTVERSHLFETAAALEELTEQRLSDITASLVDSFAGAEYDCSAVVHRSSGDQEHWFRSQVIATARKLDYFADTRTYHRWVRLRIREERLAQIVFSFHSLGRLFSGVLAVAGFLEFRDRGEEGESVPGEPLPVCVEVFQFSYGESTDQVEARFRAWLEDSVILALDQWRRQL